MMHPFTGSYSPDDVQFLLKPVMFRDTPIHIKETLIQSGQKHYSELLTHESLPSAEYLKLFYQGMALNQERVAEHLLILAGKIVATRPEGVTLVSLARAGTPIGVLLKHILKRYFKCEAAHYSISIIRDIGIDQNALRYIIQRHTPQSLVFIDGWTGKGVIARELAASLKAFAETDNVNIPAELYVLADLSGSAKVAACAEDYLIPSCILNATVSGLVSRSIYNKNPTNLNDFHGCVYYEAFLTQDLSRYFIDTLLEAVERLWQKFPTFTRIELNCEALQTVSKQFLAWLTDRYAISHTHYIKPGVGEASRVFLRREARLLLLQNLNSETTQHLRWLAESKKIPIELMPNSPYRAVALIKEIQ